MMHRETTFRLFHLSTFAPLLWFAVAAFVGCGGPEYPPPETYPVTGKVLGADGQPLTGGSIYFRLPDDPTLEAIAEIEPDGSFSLYTMSHEERYAGAIAGEHQVTVIPPAVGGDVPGAVRAPQTYRVERQPNEITVLLSGERGA